MICPKCLGGRELYTQVGHQIYMYPCPYCYGEGNIHCCEGDQEQPDGNRQEVVYSSTEE